MTLYLLNTLGKDLLELPEDEASRRIREIDRQVRDSRRLAKKDQPVAEDVLQDEPGTEESAASGWEEQLLSRLHLLSPNAFEEFVIFLLKAYGLRLDGVGGSGDEGIDAIGMAPISDVLSSRVAVQAKRYEPASAMGREPVALFQRDASAAGAERAIFVTLGRFTKAARKAGTMATPTVDMIDGEKLCELVRAQEIGIRTVPQVDDTWFDRFEK